MRTELHRMDITPKITAAHIRTALATPQGVICQDMADGSVIAYPYGLTKVQAMDDSLVVLLLQSEVAMYMEQAAGSAAYAARTATLILTWELETIEANLARYAQAAQ